MPHDHASKNGLRKSEEKEMSIDTGMPDLDNVAKETDKSEDQIEMQLIYLSVR